MNDNVVKFEKLNSKNQGSHNQALSSARLCAVQVIYQMLANKQNSKDALKDFFDYRIAEMIIEEQVVSPDKKLLSTIVQGVEAKKDDVDKILFANLSKPDDIRKKNEKLLYSIFVCGVYELLMHHDTDAPIIINEYINIGHAFFDQGEVKLINGLLDSVAKAVR